MRNRLIALGVCLLLMPGASVRAQARADSAALRIEGLTAILLGELSLATERGGDSAAAARTARAAAAVARGYRAAGRSPAIADELIARAVSTHLGGVPSSASAETLRRVDEQTFRLLLLQTAQSARLVEQNDRIIELLQALAAKR
jgi:hypothetical protein